MLCRPGVLSPATRCARSLLFTSSSSVQRERLPRPALDQALKPRASSFMVWVSPLGCRLTATTRPNRVRSSTGRQFTFGCSPPPLVRTQLPSVTGLRTRPEGDLHPSDSAHSPSHTPAGWPGRGRRPRSATALANELVHLPDEPAGGPTTGPALALAKANPSLVGQTSCIARSSRRKAPGKTSPAWVRRRTLPNQPRPGRLALFDQQARRAPHGPGCASPAPKSSCRPIRPPATRHPRPRRVGPTSTGWWRH